MNRLIDAGFNSFVEKLSAKYDISREEIEELWTENWQGYLPSKTQIVKVTKTTKTKPTTTTKAPTKTTTTTTEEKGDGRCTYKFVKGTNQGKLCGAKVKDGGPLCSKHKKNSVNVVPKPKAGSPKRMVLKLDKTTKRWYHPETSLVFKSSTDKVVCGKKSGKEVRPLTDADKEVCMEWGFPYEDEEEEEEEEEIHEEEAEEEEDEEEYPVVDEEDDD